MEEADDQERSRTGLRGASLDIVLMLLVLAAGVAEFIHWRSARLVIGSDADIDAKMEEAQSRQKAFALKRTEGSGNSDPADDAIPDPFDRIGPAAKTPEGQRLIQLARESGVAADLGQKYGPLFRELSLPRPLSNRLCELLTRRQEAVKFGVWGARIRGFTPAQARIRGAEDLAVPFEMRIRRLLGPRDFQRFREYEQTIGPRLAVNRFAAFLAARMDPITDHQADELVKVIAEHQNPANLKAQEFLNLFAQVAAPVDPRSVAAASAFLSRSQMKALQIIEGIGDRESQLREQMVAGG